MFKRFWWVLLVLPPLAAIVGLLIAAVVTYVMPKKYESSATIEVRPVAEGMEAPLMTPDAAVGYTADLQTELTRIKGRKVLARVVDAMELPNRWAVSKAEAADLLDQLVSVEMIRGTDLAVVSCRFTDRRATREITNAVVEQYRGMREEEVGLLIGERVEVLEKEVWNQQDKVEERRKVLETVERAKGMVHTPAEGTEISKEEAHGRGAEYVDVERAYREDRELLGEMNRQLTAEKIRAKMAPGVVLVHEMPTEPLTPVSPNVALNLVLGTGAGFLLGVPLALLLMFLAGKTPPKMAG